ncbi:SIMPL domain-containing protein [Patescibacteria group bacterium]|nr:SIMPL domain-containing protein [Patescibacteria group bacterium]MBU1757838.1 SIMPL domain-containing protein [Patescibacteria group bacterium]
MTNTVSVVGEGKALVTPDTLIISASVSELADSTKEAQTSANEKIEQIHKILADQDIDKKNVKTNNLNVYPEYDYREE